MIEVTREGVWEIRRYGSGPTIRRLMECPLCGCDFEKGEDRAEHFHTEHEPRDLVEAAEEVVGE